MWCWCSERTVERSANSCFLHPRDRNLIIHSNLCGSVYMGFRDKIFSIALFHIIKQSSGFISVLCYIPANVKTYAPKSDFKHGSSSPEFSSSPWGKIYLKLYPKCLTGWTSAYWKTVQFTIVPITPPMQDMWDASLAAVHIKVSSFSLSYLHKKLLWKDWSQAFSVRFTLVESKRFYL